MDAQYQLLLTTRRFRVERIRRARPGGGWNEREIIRHPGSATILPLLEDGRVCLIRNYRESVERALIELPAGTLEADETPAQTARRELIEETGYQAGRLEELAAFYPSPGILDERMYVFAARDLTMVGAAREAGEEIENLVVPWDDALAMVRDGRIEDAKTIVALLMFQQQGGA